MKLFQEYRGLRKENYILFFGRTMTAFGSMIWPMLTMILSQKLGMNARDIAILMMVGSLIGIPMNLIGGKLADRFNKKMIIVYCDIVTIIASVICAVLPLTIYSMLFFCFAAMVQTMEYPSYSALVADITPSKDRERAYSLNYLGTNLGLVLSPTISGFLFKDYLWLMFLINGIAIASSTLLIYFFLQNLEKEEDENNDIVEVGDHTPILQILKVTPIFILFFICTSLESSFYSQYSYLMPLDLGNLFGDNGAVIYGTISSVNCIVVVLFTPLITRWFVRLKEPQKLLVGDILLLAGYIIFKVSGMTILFYYVAMVVFTWGEIFATLSIDPYLTRRIPATHRGRIVAMNTVVSNLVYGISEIFIGQSYDMFGSDFTWMIVIGIGVIAILCTVLLAIQDRKKFPSLQTS